MKNETPPIVDLVGADSQGDIFNRLLKNRIVFLGSDVNDDVANLITAQRAFEANSKIVTTSDEMLQTLVNMKR